MTAQQLGEQVGVSLKEIAKYETGVDRVSASQLYRIAAVLREPVDFFFEELGSGSENGTNVPRSLEAEIIHLLNDDPQSQVGAMRLVRGYSRINSARNRRVVLHLIKVLASESG